MSEFPIMRNGDILKLQRHLGGMLSAADLRQIATADYGQEIDQHLEALVSLVREPKVFRPHAWHPGEVVALSCWVPEDFHEIGSLSPAQHRQSAFCNTVLFVSSIFEDGYYGDARRLLVRLLMLLFSLEGDIVPCVADMLIAVLQLENESDDQQKAAIAVGLFSLALRDRGWSNDELVCLIEWADSLISSDMRKLKDKFGYSYFSKTFLDFSSDRSLCRMWQNYLQRLPEFLTERHDQRVRDWVELLVA